MRRYYAIIQEFLGLVWRITPAGVGRISPRTAWTVARLFHTDCPPRRPHADR